MRLSFLDEQVGRCRELLSEHQTRELSVSALRSLVLGLSFPAALRFIRGSAGVPPDARRLPATERVVAWMNAARTCRKLVEIVHRPNGRYRRNYTNRKNRKLVLPPQRLANTIWRYGRWCVKRAARVRHEQQQEERERQIRVFLRRSGLGRYFSSMYWRGLTWQH